MTQDAEEQQFEALLARYRAAQRQLEEAERRYRQQADTESGKPAWNALQSAIEAFNAVSINVDQAGPDFGNWMRSRPESERR